VLNKLTQKYRDRLNVNHCQNQVNDSNGEKRYLPQSQGNMHDVGDVLNIDHIMTSDTYWYPVVYDGLGTDVTIYSTAKQIVAARDKYLITYDL
jgi:hypothetical protein